MPDTSDRPLSKCGACGQSDNAPKLQVVVGVSKTADGFTVNHPHDFEGNGCIYYHMDCPSPHHDNGNEAHQAIVAAALNGLQNDDLFDHIMSLPEGK